MVTRKRISQKTKDEIIKLLPLHSTTDIARQYHISRKTVHLLRVQNNIFASKKIPIRGADYEELFYMNELLIRKKQENCQHEWVRRCKFCQKYEEDCTHKNLIEVKL